MISDLPTAEAVNQKRGSPWSGIGRKLTSEEWELLKEWKNRNQLLKWKCGDVGPNGMVFSEYLRGYDGGERWITKELLDVHRAKVRELRTKRMADPVYRAWRNAREKKYGLNPEYKKRRYKKSREWVVNNRERARETVNKWSKKKRATCPIFLAKERAAGLKRRQAKTASYRLKAADFHVHGTVMVDRPLSDRIKMEAVYSRVVDLEKSTGVKHHADHIIPLRINGPHHQLNLQPLPKMVNSLKSGDAFWLSDDYLDFRDVPESLWPEKLKPYYHLMLRIFGHPLKKYAEIA